MNHQENKLPEGDIVVKNRFLTVLENFWYHYKWTVIVVVFFVLTFAICFAQCATKQTADLSVVFAGGNTLTGDQQAKINEVLDGLAPKDAKDEPLTSLLIAHSVYTDEEIRAASTDEDGEFSPATYQNILQVTQNHLDTFGTYIMSGESGVWLVSEYVYEIQNLKKLARPLSELYDTVPENANDDYAIRLADTALYQYYDVLKVLPEDTLIVMSAPLAMGAVSNAETYENYLSLYYAIVNFERP